MSVRTNVFASVICALMLLVAAFVSPPAFAQTKIAIGTAKDPNLGSQLVIARERGFFKEAGIDAEIRYFPSGGDLMAAFVGGSVQMGSSGSTPVTTLRARPFPVKFVARISDISGAQQLIVKQSVKSLEELYGAKIGVLRGTASDALFQSIVKGYGLDASKFTVLNLGPTEMLQAFVRGEVAAVALWEAHSTRARKLGNGKILVSATQSFIPGKEAQKRIMGDHSMLFAHENYIRDNPAAIRAVLTALLRANDYIDKNRGQATNILAKEFDLDPADMADVMAANRYTLGLDEQMLADMSQLAEFLYGLKRISTQPKASEWVEPALLRALRPDLVKLK